MNYALAINISFKYAAGYAVPQQELQEAFDRLSKPDMLIDTQASEARSILWNSDQVCLD